MPPCNCHHPFPRPEPFSPLPRPGQVPDWGKWIRDRLAEKGALLTYPSIDAFPDPGAGPNLYLAEDTDIVYRWDGAHYQVVFEPASANDVLEYEDRGHFPETGRHGKLYIAADTGSLYRWDDTDYAELLPGKADKVVPAAEGNLAALAQDGNLADSGKKPADFATAAQGAKADTAVQSIAVGTSTVEPGEGGVLTLPVSSSATSSSETTVATSKAVKLVNDKVTVIEGKIPSQASASNQLADKDFVNSSIATETATFRKTFNLVTDLGLPLNATHEQVAAAVKTELGQTAYDGNDYVFVQIPQDLEHTDAMKQVDRYKCVETGTDPVVKNWEYEWTLNNSSFTAAQWAAIVSGITSGLVAKLKALQTADALAQALAGKRDYTDLSYNTQVTVNAPALHAILTSRGTQLLEYYLPCTEVMPATPRINHVYTWRKEGAEFYITQGVSVYSTSWKLFNSSGEQLSSVSTDNATQGYFPALTFETSAYAAVTSTKVNSYPDEVQDALALDSNIAAALAGKLNNTAVSESLLDIPLGNYADMDSIADRLDSVVRALKGLYGPDDRTLYFRSLQDGSTVAMQKVGSAPDVLLEYSIDDGVNWSPFVVGETPVTLNRGKWARIRATSEATQTQFATSPSAYNKFLLGGSITVGGNSMSLFYHEYADIAAATAFPDASKSNILANLFQGDVALKDASSLVLPATTLASFCYNSMFQGCTLLTAAPELPATTLASYCYGSMFQGCTSLTDAPELPATTLASYCYSGLFSGCTSLTDAPELPATTLGFYCYSDMFSGCTSLTAAPELPATVLASSCYSSMFRGCTSLTSVYVDFGAWSPSNATSNWLNGVAATGEFHCKPGLDTSTTGGSTVPSGWTVFKDR